MPTPGVRLTVLAGPTLPVPIPAPLTERLRSVEVTESDQKRSVFSITFDAGRSGGPDIVGETAWPLPAFARVVVMVTWGALPKVLCDGIVTETRLDPGQGTLTILGEDISYLLDREERDVEHPCLSDYLQVLRILAPYAARGLVPAATPPLSFDLPLPVERVPTQHGTDLDHLAELALRNGYVTCAVPGPAPGTSFFYWGPPVRAGVPQPALSVDMGPGTNVTELSFRTEAHGPVTVSGAVIDRKTGTKLPVSASASLRLPLSAVPLWLENADQIRSKRARDTPSNAATAAFETQAEVNRSVDAVIAEGKLDGARYGGLLRPRGLVGVRGAGWAHDGLWYVREVKHELSRGGYRAGFVLARDGHGSTVPAVPVGWAAW